MTESPTFIDVRQAAAIASVSPMSIYRLIDADVIPHVRIGRLIRIPERGFMRYLTDQLDEWDEEEW
jgi:excisionase family DNA binding protein